MAEETKLRCEHDKVVVQAEAAEAKARTAAQKLDEGSRQWDEEKVLYEEHMEKQRLIIRRSLAMIQDERDLRAADREMRLRTPAGTLLDAAEQGRDAVKRELDVVVRDRDALAVKVESMRRNLAERDRLVSQAREAGRVAGAASREPDVQAANDRAAREVVEVRERAAIDVKDARTAGREAGRREGLAARGEEVDAVREQSGVLQAGLDAAKTELTAVKTELTAAKTELTAAKADRDAVRNARDAVRGELKTVRGELKAVKSELGAEKKKFADWRNDVSVSGPGGDATPARRSISKKTLAPGPGRSLADVVQPE